MVHKYVTMTPANSISLINRRIKESMLGRTSSLTMPPRGGGGSRERLTTSGSRRGGAWSLYVLHLTALPLLYNEIISTAASYEETNPGVYYELVLEGHYLLKSKLALPQNTVGLTAPVDAVVALNMNIEAKNYRSLLRRSSTLLGNYYFKQREYIKAAQQYSSSDRPIADVVRIFLAEEQAEAALTVYLDRVLFDVKMANLLDEEDERLSDRILKHYHRYAPQRLASLILDSCLSVYTQSLALKLLGTIPNDKKGGLDAKIMFAQALLHIDMSSENADKCDQAIAAFKMISPSSLVEYCISNPKLLSADPSLEQPHGVPILGKLLRECSPWALLEIAVHLSSPLVKDPNQRSESPFTHNEQSPFLSIQTAIAMLQKSPGEGVNIHPDQDLDNLLLKCFYEHLILESRHVSEVYTDQWVLELASLYLKDIARHRGADEPLFALFKDDGDALEINKNSFVTKWRRFHRRAFYQRPGWLDFLPPFTSIPRSSSTVKLNPYEVREDEDINYRFLYVRKCQGLLLRQKRKHEDGQVGSLLPMVLEASNQNTDQDSTISLRLLCLPMAGQLSEAVDILVGSFPHISFDFGKQFCTNPNDWSLLLDALLARCEEASVYEQILEYLTGYYDPDAFMNLLPARGHLVYFLPYIEKSFYRHKAKTVQSSISQFMRELELEQAAEK